MERIRRLFRALHRAEATITFIRGGSVYATSRYDGVSGIEKV
jgi:hypothetical protein